MTDLSLLLLGLGLGLRHATDADHIVVVSTLAQREHTAWRAMRIAALWGAGHTVAFLTLGLLIVLAELRLPPAFERGADLLVGTMLVGLGAWQLTRSRVAVEEALEVPAALASARPIMVGLIHGLAGSAGVALLAVTTIRSRPLAAMYLALVALGTVFGMVTLTVAMSRPIGWAMRRKGRVRHVVSALAPLLSVTLGAMVILHAVLGEPAP